jgi:hypothetical protein
MNALTMAACFHETYERLAPWFGYETRPETREFDPDSVNGRLMIAVCEEIRTTFERDNHAATILADLSYDATIVEREADRIAEQEENKESPCEPQPPSSS